LFHDEGLTVAGWIRQRRLDRCRRDLTDAVLASRSVASIAARWAFCNPAEFSPTFRAAHGMTPTEFRTLARAAQGSAL
jgi:AraC-like DNA-binding protein